MHITIIYKKRIRRFVQVLKEMSLDIAQNITLSRLNVNLTSNLFMWVMIFDQIYRKMKKEASVKHDLMKKILHTDFLKENLLKQEYELENERVLYEKKLPNLVNLKVIIRDVECKVFTKDDNNIMKVLIQNYRIEGLMKNNILTAKNIFENFTLLSDKVHRNHMNRDGKNARLIILGRKSRTQTVYLNTRDLVVQESRNNNYEDKLPREFLFKFETIDLFYN